ncbi:MAG: NmrA family protein [Candidatus Saccharibacteria bacterium]|nr:NmrA family protein [Candidatus Saccharibacteria bacterium]
MSNQVTVFGANGKVGSLVVAELLARQYSVIAFVRGSNPFPVNPHLKVVQGDIYDEESVAAALVGSSIVVSTLGSWGTPKKDVLTAGMMHIIAAMKAQQITRIVSLTGAESRASGDQLGVIHRLMHLGLYIVAAKVLADGEKHIKLLQQSNLDWMVIRSPIMTSLPIATYRLGDKRPLPLQLVSRRSVVLAIADTVSNGVFSKQAPFIT